MRRSLMALFTLALISSPVILADDKPAKDIVDTAVGAKSFTKLVAAVKAADLVDTLKGPGPFTVFAPTDEAFDKIGEEKLGMLLKNEKALKRVLMAHVIVGKEVLAKDVVGMDGEMVPGTNYKIMVKDGKVTLSNGKDTVKVLKTDIKAKNGVIHVIDTVLTPSGKGGKGSKGDKGGDN